MRFTVSRQILTDALSLLMDVIPLRSAKPVLQNVKLEGTDKGTVVLSATDLEIGLNYEIPVEALTEAETVLLPAARLFGFVRDEWAETLRFSIHESQVELTTDNGTFHLTGSSDEFPPIASLDGDKDVIEMNGADLADAVQKTAFSVARDDTRYALNGVLLNIEKGQAEFVSSDTHRLSLVRKRVKNKDNYVGQAIVVTKGMGTLSKLAQAEETLRLCLTSHELIAQTSCATLIARLVDGQFPRYKEVIPKDLPLRVTVNRELLQKTLRLAGQAAHEESRAMVLTGNGDTLEASALGGEFGDATVKMPAKIEGGELHVSFNYTFILDLLKTLSDEELTLHFRDAKNPLRVDSGDFLHVIMPITAPR